MRISESPRQTFQQLPLILRISKNAGTPAGGVEVWSRRSWALPSAPVMPYALPCRQPTPWVNAAGPSATPFRPPCPHIWDGVSSRRHHALQWERAAVTRNYPVIASKCFWKISFCTGQESGIASRNDRGAILLAPCQA